jgi:putative PIG3 family NAD(P)H quinone oxidoreductase
MLAIAITSFGPPEVLQLVERPLPLPQDHEIVVQVEAAGVARADLLQRQGKYPPPPGASDIPGLDVAGTVYAVGSAVESWRPGDRVCAILSGGGYAEYCAVPEVQVLPIPRNWSAQEAATLPENLFTAYDNLITRARLTSGETILIHGGSSGVGSMALMLSRGWGALPLATAGSAEKCKACLSFGAEHAILYKDLDFVTEVRRLTSGRGVDVILDMVGGSYLDRNLDALAIEGRLVIIATSGGRSAQLDLTKLLSKRARVLASTMRSRSPDMKGQVARALRRDVWPLLPAKNHVRPIIDSAFPLAEAKLAHQRLESGQNIGKVVLTVADSRGEV